MEDLDTKVVQRELNKELVRLQLKYETGFELIVEWEPRSYLNQPPNMLLGKGRCAAEVVPNGNISQFKIVIYEARSLERIIHCLHHEFLEHMLVADLAQPFVDYANSLQRTLEQIQYKCQEKRVENLAKMEDENWNAARKKRD